MTEPTLFVGDSTTTFFKVDRTNGSNGQEKKKKADRAVLHPPHHLEAAGIAVNNVRAEDARKMISASDFIDGQVMVLRVIVADLKFDTILEVTQPRGSSSEITDRRSKGGPACELQK